MNEQLQQALAVLIEKSINGIDASVNFMQAEIPEVIEQLLMWYAVKGFIFFAISILLFVSWVVASKMFWDYKKEEDAYMWEQEVFFASAVAFIVIGMIMIFTMNIEWLQIWIAPKVWLIEYASKIAS